MVTNGDHQGQPEPTDRRRLFLGRRVDVAHLPPVPVPSCWKLGMGKGLAVLRRDRGDFDPYHAISATSQSRCHRRSGQPP